MTGQHHERIGASRSKWLYATLAGVVVVLVCAAVVIYESQQVMFKQE